MYQSEVEFTPVEPGHVEYVAANIRECDRVEVYESSKRDVLIALSHSVERSDRTMTMQVGGVPVAIAGVGRLSLTSTVGVPWMLGTDDVTRRSRLLLPHGPAVVRRMMQSHDVLRNLVHDENKASIRWLRSLGFRLSDPIKTGWRGGVFRMFELTKEELNV